VLGLRLHMQKQVVYTQGCWGGGAGGDMGWDSGSSGQARFMFSHSGGVRRGGALNSVRLGSLLHEGQFSHGWLARTPTGLGNRFGDVFATAA
jgi:hypothetical protein